MRKYLWIPIGIAVLILAAALVHQKPAPVEVPAPQVALELHLKTSRQDYIRLEPVLATIDVKETSAMPYAVNLSKDQCAGKLDILQVEEGGAVKRVGGDEFCHQDRTNKPQGGFFKRNWRWQWGLARVGKRYWFQNSFPPGQVKLRAVLTLVKPGVQFVSNEVTIDVREPEGVDLQAYKFLTSAEPINLDNETITAATIMDTGLFRSSGSQNAEKAHRYFVAHYPDSIYAEYVRYTMAQYLSQRIAAATEEQRETAVQNYVSMMTEITQRPPGDFPFLPQIYYSLIRHYKLRDDTAKFHELKEEVIRRGIDADEVSGIKRLLQE